jgi:REP element-mobilizing transposase RayT
MTVVGWIDVFTRKNFKFALIDALEYCQKEKGLAIYGYCIMSSHIHLIVRSEGQNSLSDILRDFKKFTSKEIIKQIINESESRKGWMLEYFKKAQGKSGFKFWKDGNHLEMITSNKFFDEKLEYIHNNPVKEMIVERPEDYLFSSARNYAGLSNFLEVIMESVKLQTYR